MRKKNRIEKSRMQSMKMIISRPHRMQTAGNKMIPSFGCESSSASDWTVSRVQDEKKTEVEEVEDQAEADGWFSASA